MFYLTFFGTFGGRFLMLVFNYSVAVLATIVGTEQNRKGAFKRYLGTSHPIVGVEYFGGKIQRL